MAGGHQRPAVGSGALNWRRVAELSSLRATAGGRAVNPTGGAREPALLQRVLARRAYTSGDLRAAYGYWIAQSEGPQGPMDVTMVAEIFAAAADARALGYIDELRALQPAEAEAILALWYHNAHQPEPAIEHLVAAFHAYRDFPWSHRFVFNRGLDLAWTLASERPDLGGRLFEALADPFAAHALDAPRLSTNFSIAILTDFAAHCVAALAPLEPYVPWDGRLLAERDRCYQSHNDPRAAQARADLEAFLADSPTTLDHGGSG